MSLTSNDTQNAPELLHWFTMKFRDGDQESRYRAAQRDRNLRQTRLAIGIAILLNSAYAIFDPMHLPENQTLLTIIRLVAMNAILFAAIPLSRTEYMRTRWPAMLALIAIEYTIFYCIVIVFGKPSSLMALTYVVAILAYYVMLPFYFTQGLTIAVFCTVVYGAVVVIFRPDIAPADHWIIISAMATANIIGAIALYRTERFRRFDFVNTEAVVEERNRSKRLLHRILPRPVAERMDNGEDRIVDQHTSASVLFADIAGFTNLASGEHPEEVLDLLNGIFADFDDLVAKHGLEKIKTIGDAYMVAGGLPTERDNHVAAMAELALDMRDRVAQWHTKGGEPVAIRIGLHSGPVVAGVIGESRFLYDLWGDTVNIASRMESAGVPDRIQVTEAVRDALQDRYAFEPRGAIEVKGKGPMPTWYLTGRQLAAA